MKIYNKSVKHLTDNKMTYFQHLLFAFRSGLKCINAGILLILHGFFPAFFQKSGSSRIFNLNKILNGLHKF